jgi:hypothetical protein
MLSGYVCLEQWCRVGLMVRGMVYTLARRLQGGIIITAA